MMGQTARSGSELRADLLDRMTEVVEAVMLVRYHARSSEETTDQARTLANAALAALVRSGHSDKYGQVYVERVGHTGFDDPTEPVALLRAQDEIAYGAMIHYLARCEMDPGVPREQVESVRRQLAAFAQFRQEHPDRIRTPGTQPDA